MKKGKKKESNYRECKFAKVVDGIRMCYAIGCCEVGDMACECEDCNRPCSKKKIRKGE